MRKPLSPAVKYKLNLFAVYIFAIVFCIFWLTAEIDITRRVKQDRMTSEELLAAAESEISGGSAEQMSRAAERLSEFYSLTKRNSEAKSVLTAFRRGFPKFSADELKLLRAVSEEMHKSPEAFAPRSGELVKAIKLIREDVGARSQKISPEALKILGDIADEAANAAE